MRWLFVAALCVGCAAGSGDSAFAHLEFEPLSPWAARLHARTSAASERALTLMPAHAGPFVLSGDATSVTICGLEPGTEYTVSASVVGAQQSTRDEVRGSTPAARKLRVLFDAAHGQTAGNADWVIDDDATPDPAEPDEETDWKGSYSSWAYDLHDTGRYEIESIRSGTLTYATGGAFDLAEFDVLVLPEPNNWGDLGERRDVDKGEAERAAVVAFVKAGGGLVMLADHRRSDRDNDGVDSIPVLNALLDELACGLTFNEVDEYESSSVFGDSPVVTGPFHRLARVSLYNGTTLTIDPALGALAVAYLPKVTDPSAEIARNWVMGATCEAGLGRVFAYGDSSIANDGTGRVVDPTKNAWGDFERSHRRMLLNATEWTACVY